jgi:hypothetical protein
LVPNTLSPGDRKRLLEVASGVHYRKLESDIPARMCQQVLEALNHPGIAKALQRMPIEKISIGRLGDKQHPAWYDSHAQSVSINSARKLGVHFGEGFSPGRTWNMSAATRDKVESMRRSLLQETAHHIEASIPGVKEAVARAWANPNRNPITQYAGQEPGEYFAVADRLYGRA